MNHDRHNDSADDRSLEVRLRGHYEELGRTSSIALKRRIGDELDRRSNRRPAFHFPVGRRAMAGLVAGVAAVIVVALVVGPLLLGPSEPMAGKPTPTPTPTRTPVPIASTGSISPTTLPAPDPSVVLAGARTQVFGAMRRGGAFWGQGDSLSRAPDAHSSRGDSPWPQSDTTPPAVFVLDQDHIWTITVGPGSSDPYGGQGTEFDHLKAVVNRTAHNGVTVWQQASVPGDYADSMLSLSFVDESHGFMMASGGPSQFSATILRTDDGGATWSVVATIKTGGVLGGWFTASDRSTLWAGAQAEASSHGHPLLSVSRDGGKTWSEANLPGMGGYPGGIDAYLEQAPVFLDSKTGFVAVDYGNGDGSGVAVFSTTDAGRTWIRQNAPSTATSVDFVDATHWMAVTRPPLEIRRSSISATSDGGRTWITTESLGPDSTPMKGDWVSLVFFDQLNGYGLFKPPSGVAFAAPTYYLYRTTSGGLSWELVSSAD